MDTKEYKFYLCYGAAEFLYKFVIIGFLCFAFFFVYEQLGLTVASALIYLFIVINGVILLFPLICINGKRPLYVIDGTGIKQNKYLFWPRVLPWSHIRSISYPANALIGGKDAISFDLHTSRINHRLVIISLSDIDDPPAFLQAVNIFKPYGYDQSKGGIYFQLYHDREKILYITLLYLCVTISLVLASTFDAPYVWIESNKYSVFWALLFFTHLFFSIVVSFFAYKDIQKRKSMIKAAILFWFFVTLGPFIVEQNVYYNFRAITAEKKGDYDSAEQYIREAIRIYPEGYSYYATLGKILFQKGKYLECIDQFNFLLERDYFVSDYGKANYYLWIGKALQKLNKIEMAHEAFEKVKEFKIADFNEEIKSFTGQHF